MFNSSRRLIAVPLLLLHAAAALLGDGLHSVLHCEHGHLAHSASTADGAALEHHCGCSHGHADSSDATADRVAAQRGTRAAETRELTSAHHCVVCEWLTQLNHAVAFSVALLSVERIEFAATASPQDVQAAISIAQPARGPPASATREA